MAETMRDWNASLARRSRSGVSSDAVADILALSGVTDTITLFGGFPIPETFPTGAIGELTSQLLSDDIAVALQYSPAQGLASVRGAISDRLGQVEGRSPVGEVTSGGIDALKLISKRLLDPGYVVLVEAPTCLGALIGFTRRLDTAKP